MTICLISWRYAPSIVLYCSSMRWARISRSSYCFFSVLTYSSSLPFNSRFKSAINSFLPDKRSSQARTYFKNFCSRGGWYPWKPFSRTKLETGLREKFFKTRKELWFQNEIPDNKEICVWFSNIISQNIYYRTNGLHRDHPAAWQLNFVNLVYQPGHLRHLWVLEEFPGLEIRPSDVLIFFITFYFLTSEKFSTNVNQKNI